MPQQLILFFTALMFFTRLPCPKDLPYSSDLLNKASRYFPAVGLVVGGIAALTYILAHLILPHEIAVLLSMMSSIWVTGAFHEDGFADMCDGFGGGWTQDRILEIMKDSRLGTFGAVGIGLVLTLKYLCLIHLSPDTVPIILLVGHSLSRFVTLSFLVTHNYVQADLQSKAKPLATKLSYNELFFAGFFIILPLLFLPAWYYSLLVIPLFIIKKLLGRFFQQWIGGYTGDCLGATQQVTEVIFYLGSVALMGGMA